MSENYGNRLLGSNGTIWSYQILCQKDAITYPRRWNRNTVARVNRPMSSSASSLSIVFSFVLVASVPATAQPPVTAAPAPQSAAQAPTRFEVVSIHPHQLNGDDSSNRQVLPGGRFVATNTTVHTLVRIAFIADDNRINGLPSWTNDETFDISGTTVNRAEVTTPQEFQQLLLSLLEDRFQLKFHTEKKEVPVYRLELASPGKLGPALKPSTPASQPNMSTNSNGSMAAMKVSKASMADIAATLARQAHRPVEDHTGLQGEFDFQIEWAADGSADSSAPSIFTVLSEQLGLKLRPAKGTVDTFVVDQIARPAAN